MKKVSLFQIASDVAAVRGEALIPECHPEESPFPSLEIQVSLLVLPILEDLIKEMPANSFTGTKHSSPDFSVNDEGVVEILLPEDFLRLIQVKMSDWRRAVNEMSEYAGFLFSKWKGIRGNPSHPVAVRDFSVNGKPVLKLYTSSRDAVPESFVYIARPVIDSSGFVTIEDELYPRLLQRLAEILWRDT